MLTCRTLIQPPWKLSKDYNKIIYFYSKLIFYHSSITSTSLLLLYFSLREVTQRRHVRIFPKRHDMTRHLRSQKGPMSPTWSVSCWRHVADMSLWESSTFPRESGTTYCTKEGINIMIHSRRGGRRDMGGQVSSGTRGATTTTTCRRVGPTQQWRARGQEERNTLTATSTMRRDPARVVVAPPPAFPPSSSTSARVWQDGGGEQRGGRQGRYQEEGEREALHAQGTD
jgi:hypothetical protein